MIFYFYKFATPVNRILIYLFKIKNSCFLCKIGRLFIFKQTLYTTKRTLLKGVRFV